MFERFTERARQTVVFAQEEARTLTHSYIGVEHVLLGLLREEEGLAARVLEDFDITTERVRAQVVRIVGSGEKVSGQIPFTPRAKKVLENSLREVLALNSRYVDTEHILLGLLREDEGVAARILADFGAERSAIRAEVMRVVSERPSRGVSPRAGTETRLPGKGARSKNLRVEAVDEPAELEAVPTHADRPADRDELGRARLAEVLGERMRRVRGEDTERPVSTRRLRREKRRLDREAARRAGSFMVHVHAPWGPASRLS